MSSEYEGKDPLTLAQEAEQSLNAHPSAHPNPYSQKDQDTSTANDPDASGLSNTLPNLPGATARTGAEATGRVIPPDEGGDVVLETKATQASHPSDSVDGKGTGSVVKERGTRAEEFEGEVGEGPEAARQKFEQERPGDDSVRGNIR